MSKSLIEEEPPDDEPDEPQAVEPQAVEPQAAADAPRAAEPGVRLATVDVASFTIPGFTGNEPLTLTSTPTELSVADAQRAREQADTAGVRLRTL